VAQPPHTCNLARRVSRSVRPAPLAVTPEVISRRAGAPPGKRMANSAGAAPPSRPASFGNLDDEAIGIADRSGGDPCAGGGRKTNSQRGAQNDRPCHLRCSLCSANPDRTPRLGSEIGTARRYHSVHEKQSGGISQKSRSAPLASKTTSVRGRLIRKGQRNRSEAVGRRSAWRCASRPEEPAIVARVLDQAISLGESDVRDRSPPLLRRVGTAESRHRGAALGAIAKTAPAWSGVRWRCRIHNIAFLIYVAARSMQLSPRKATGIWQ